MPEGTVVDFSTLDEQGGYSLTAAFQDPPEVRRLLAASGNGAISPVRTSSPQAVAPTARSFTFKVRPFFGWSATTDRLRSLFAEHQVELLEGPDERTVIQKHRDFCFRVSEEKAPAAVLAAAECGHVTLRGSQISKPWAPARQKNCRQPNPPKSLKVALKQALSRSKVLKKEIEVAKRVKLADRAQPSVPVTHMVPGRLHRSLW